MKSLNMCSKEIIIFQRFPIIYLTNIMSKIRAGYGYKDVNTAAEIAKSDIPVLFIHGENDEFVPHLDDYEKLFPL